MTRELEVALLQLIQDHSDELHSLLEEQGVEATLDRATTYEQGGYLTRDRGFVLDFGTQQIQVTLVDR